MEGFSGAIAEWRLARVEKRDRGRTRGGLAAAGRRRAHFRARLSSRQALAHRPALRLGGALEGLAGLVGLALAVPHRGVDAAARRAARACVPRSTIRPWSRTMISSAPITVDSRWAMTSVVRPRLTRSRASWISFSVKRIERRGRLVEDEDRRPLEDRAGDGDALLLAARELQAALADRRRRNLPAGAPMKRSIWARRAASRTSSGGGVPAAVLDVVADRVVEQHRVLRNHADRGAQRGLLHRRRCPGRR